MTPTVAAGAVAGAIALLVFVAVHAVWIVPIWGMLSMLPLAALVGILAAMPFEQMIARGAFPPPPLDGPAFAALLILTLIPTAASSVLLGPVDPQRIQWPVLLLPLLLAAPAGAAAGLALTGSPGTAASLGIAATALALTLGHNIPFFPAGSPGWVKAHTLIVLPVVVAGLVFPVARALGSLVTGVAWR